MMKESLKILHQSLRESKIPLMLLAGQVIMCSFLMFRELAEGEVCCNYFPFSNQLISPQSHVYYISDHLRSILYAGIILYALPRLRDITIAYLTLEVLDLIDYLVRYNENIAFGWLDFNVIKVVSLGICIGIRFIIFAHDNIKTRAAT
jgi:hypothetical protein